MTDQAISNKLNLNLPKQADSPRPEQDSNAANLIRQAQKIRPLRRNIAIAEFIDVTIIGIIGAITASLSILIFCLCLPHIELKALLYCLLSVGLSSFFIFFLSAMFPLLPAVVVFLQLGCGFITGSIVLNLICMWFNVLPESLGALSSVWTFAFTMLFTFLPPIASPLYFTLLLSSKLKGTVGWKLAGLMVVTDSGAQPTRMQALHRTMLRLLWPLLYPRMNVNSKELDEWVEKTSGTILVLQPKELKREIGRLRGSVKKSREKISISGAVSLSERKS